jgi:hypothetical protein
MTRKSCFTVLIATLALPLFAACSSASTTEPNAVIRHDGNDGTTLVGCRDMIPWGIAPCPSK